ncbi:MAG: DUF6249 domain-containing protein [Calditrichaceae bacterium]
MRAEILVPLTFFISVSVVIYQYFRNRHIEKMSIIEKGIGGDELKHLLGHYKKNSNNLNLVKIGIILIGIGLAILIGNFMPEDSNEQVTLSLIFLFPGLGLLIFYHFFQKNEGETE